MIKLQNWRKTRPVGHFFSSITPQPSYLVAGILGGDTFKSDFDKIISCMPEDTEQHKIAKIYMQGIIKEIEQSEVDIAEIDKLQIFLDEKDRRRGTDWNPLAHGGFLEKKDKVILELGCSPFHSSISTPQYFIENGI